MATKDPVDTPSEAAPDTSGGSLVDALVGSAGADTAKRGPAAWAERIGGLWTLGVLIALIVAFGFVAHNFYSQANWLATSEYAVEYLMLALGETFVIVTAGIDLSVGATLGFSGMAGALLMADLLGSSSGSLPTTVVGIVVILAAGTVVGLVNGLLITKLHLTPFIVTLGILGMATGAIYLLNNGVEVSTVPSQFGKIGTTVIAGWLPVPVLVTAGFCVLTWLLLARTRFGLRTYAIGSNEAAARRAGIDVDRHLLKVYALTGFLAGVAGLLVTARFTAASVTAGLNDELDAIAAVVIGGASLFGGRGSILGTIIGTFVISVLVTGLILANVQSFWQQVAVGAVLIGAVWADQLRGRLRQR